MPTKNILHVIESLEFGGAEKLVVSLANWSSNNGDKVSICCLKRYGDLVKELNKDIKLYCLNKSEGNSITAIFNLYRLIRDNNFNVIHGHNWGCFLELGLSTFMKSGIITIHTIHGPYLKYASSIVTAVKIFIRHMLERFISLSFYKIVPVSDSIKLYILNENKLAENKIQVIHNGVDCENAVINTNSSQSRVKFVSVGRLASEKNHIMMFSALKLLIDKKYDVELLIIGDGPERAALEKYVHVNKLDDNICLLGFRSDIFDLLKTADIYLMSSRFEGISMAALEAMCASLPIISTDVGGVKETVEDKKTGYLCGLNDLDAYVKCMESLINDRERRLEFGANGRLKVMTEFSNHSMYENYNKLYQSK